MAQQESLKIGIVGASGRMGRQIIDNALAAGDIEVIFGIVAPGEPSDGEVIDGVKFPFSSDWEDGFKGVDVIIDFSSPAGTTQALEFAQENSIALVVGSTGYEQSLKDKIVKAGKKIPIVLASNCSVGVNVLNELVSQAAKMLGDEFDIEVLDIHHKLKKDAPSGTALTLAEHAIDARGVKAEDVLTKGRVGDNALRRDGEIGVQTFRGGDVVGEHTVFFFGSGERIELTHRASDRGIFARGSLRAARWLSAQPVGIYSMRDVLSVS